MKVKIMYRNTYDGGDGWKYYTMLVTISDYCLECGNRRGTPFIINQCEDGEYFSLHIWENPCGHIDTYEKCYREAQK